ncbi:MAG: ATP-binding cassette domain-containing protein, partial [Bacillales bacterium]
MGLEIRQLNKTFGSRHAVKNLNIHLEEGNILGLLGRNGAGKTTTIRMILNIVKPDSGSILWKGKPFSRKEISVGYLPEERGLYPKLKVREQLIYLGKLRGMNKQDILVKMEEWLERFKIPHLARQHAHTLSGGEAQRVSLARALVVQPDILFLDEPFSALDFPTKIALMQDLKPILRETKTTTLFVSHDLLEVT